MDAVGTSPLAQALLHRVNDDARRQAVSLHAPGGSLRLDHGQLWDWVEQLTRQFQQRGLCVGDRLAWLGLNHPLQLAALMACARLGAIFMPLNFRLASAELQQVLNDATPAWLVHDAGHADVAAVLRGPGLLSQHEL
ncbi:MAG: acyl--CoA ligase, partial [Hydrogenophaga sp.]|nr:acyl--CoA ligase [Hydrogenophaga sp.]